MKVLITGSSGFIGSNLVDACLDNGWEVVGVDNLSTGFAEMADPMRFANAGLYSFAKMDINDTEKLASFMDGCDVVFHLAALPRVSFSVEHPIEADRANIAGTLSVLEAARISKVGRLVFSCSSSVYGGVAQFPTPESADASPKSPYALHKQTGAEYCRLYSELHGMDTCSLLYFNVYGPHQRANSAYATVIPAFMECAVEGKSCRIDGDGNQSRDFTYVSDVVNANILASQYAGKFCGDRFNIACGNSFSVNDVFYKIQEAAGNKLNKHFAPVRAGDPYKSLADVSKAKSVFGFEAKVGFDEGIKKTYDWWMKGCPV